MPQGLSPIPSDPRPSSAHWSWAPRPLSSQHWPQWEEDLEGEKGSGWGARTPRSGVTIPELWSLPTSVAEGFF